MHIASVHIEGFRQFSALDLELNPDLTIIVGDNETGKSSLLQAMALALTCKYQGRLLLNTIDPYLFNLSSVTEFFRQRQAGQQATPPRVLIEAYLSGNDPDNVLPTLQGTHNSKGADCAGVSLTIEPDDEYGDALAAHAADTNQPPIIPVEYYRTSWRSFKGDGLSPRRTPFKPAVIDTSVSRIVGGPDRYVASLIDSVLSPDQHRAMALAFRQLHYKFMDEEGVAAINEALASHRSSFSTRSLTVQMDLSSRSSWDNAITPHLDALPFDCSGQGEQSRAQMRLAIAGARTTPVVLIEEPENHLSHAGLNRLLHGIAQDCAEQQVVLTTHSTFVLNKLGIDKLRLLSAGGRIAEISSLASDTRDYFMKLPGYNTLRLVLAPRCVLVEGPSDELIFQRAYHMTHGKMPLQDGVDVIAVGSLAFRRFLEVAAILRLSVQVVIDNDSKVESLRRRYRAFLGDAHPTIRIHYDPDESCPTLENQLLRANSVDLLNGIFGTAHDEGAILKYMKDNKTDCALQLFETPQAWNVPEYIANAIT